MGLFDFINQKEKTSMPYENTISHISELVIRKIPNKQIAYQFVMEELDAARQGDHVSIAFVENSGFLPNEYIGAMNNSCEEVDGAGGPQQELIKQAMAVVTSMEDMRDIKLGVVQQVIDAFNLQQKDDTTGEDIFTSPFTPKIEVQDQQGVELYILKLSKFSYDEVCTELSNIGTARHNIMLHPTGISDYAEKQNLISDLNDKWLIIFTTVLGQETIMNYISDTCSGDIRLFTKLLDTIDNEVSQLDLSPEKYGKKLIDRVTENIGI